MKTISIVLIVLLSGCASYRPIVDSRGVNNAAYESDLRECQAYADQVSPGGHTAIGAIIGGGLSLALAIIGGGDRGASAGMGAVLGGAAGAGGGAEAQVNVIRNCMNGRGYRVLQ